MTVVWAFGSPLVTLKAAEIFLFPAAHGSAARRTRQRVAVFMSLLLSVDGDGCEFTRRCRVAPDDVVAPHHVEAAGRGITPHHVVAPHHVVGQKCLIAPHDIDRKSTRLNSSHL